MDDKQFVRIGKSLETNTTVRKLVLGGEGCSATIVGWMAIFEMLQTNKSIQMLEFGHSNIDFNCAQVFAMMVLNSHIASTSWSITHLSFKDDKQIGINGLFVIIDAIVTTPNISRIIQTLNFNNVIDKNMNTNNSSSNNSNELNKQLATKFVSLLQTDQTCLNELQLSDNSFGDDFATIFVTGLKHNTQLQKLTLSGNKITNVGAQALANVLCYNKTLTLLSLWYNNITDDGAIAITHSLRYHPSLHHLFFANNYISNDGVAQAFQFLKYNESLQFLDIFRQEGTNINDHETMIPQLQSILQYNDTILDIPTPSQHIRLLLDNNRRRGEYSAPKKGSRRRQDIYNWLYT